MLVKPVVQHKRMEKKEEYGVPWLWKRVPVGTWVKKCKWLIEGVLWVYFSGKLVESTFDH